MQATVAKQYLTIGQQTVIEHTISNLLSHPAIQNVVVVLHPNDTHFAKLACAIHPQVHTCLGGKERVDSVLQGLRYCVGDNPKSTTSTQSLNQAVLVHDAARPCVSHAEIDALLHTYEALGEQAKSSAGAILATPVVDTIKQQIQTQAKQSQARIESTIDRSLLWQAQTPQLFDLSALINAIENALKDNIGITDEASAMEHIGATVILVEGRPSNIKITRPGDLSLAEFYLKLNNKEA
jgi:2-C-methyl-D-erythritol 4-phosphate cytidylyltransferase